MEEIKECKSGIYMIKNIVNGKVYIGGSVNIPRRKYTHFYQLKNNKHYNLKLQRAFNKYGENNFEFSIIELCDNDQLIAMEQFYIDTNEPFYNNSKIASNCIRFELSQQAKQKISDNNRKRKLSEYTKQKIREKALGRKCSIETKKKISDIHKGNTYCLGFKHSDETKLKRSRALIGKISKLQGRRLSTEHKNKISIANTGKFVGILNPMYGRPSPMLGKKHSLATIDKLKNKIVTQETKNKMSMNHANVTGSNNPMYGISMSEDVKNKISENRKGKGNKPIVHLTIKSLFICIYNSIGLAEDKTGVCRQSIGAVCNGKRQTAGGYKWMYLTDYEALQQTNT